MEAPEHLLRLLIGIVICVQLGACIGSNGQKKTDTASVATPLPTVLRVAAHVNEGAAPPVLYNGRWEFVSNRGDGRFAGRSARSYHQGDSMTILFEGTRLLIYGITGRNGGRGTLLIPGMHSRLISFVSPTKRVHQLVYDSGTMQPGMHSVALVVSENTPAHPTGYVNIDEVEIRR